ncbi:MAG: hypothetical protein WCI11_18510 [Candidatus Methylumidiphilus sp.]
MKTLPLFTLLFIASVIANLAQAGNAHYGITLIFTDDTTFRGTFDYDTTSQQVANLKGELDDVLMGNIEPLNYQLGYGSDGKGGINAYAFELNTSVIGTNPPLNNNAGVRINFKAQDPTLGIANADQLAYMDCSVGGLMGKTCMYYLPGHNPIIPMEGGHGVLSEKIAYLGPIDPVSPVSPSDCLFNWAEKNYSQLFYPAGVGSQTSSPYYYRYYQKTNSYLGISSADNHVYYLGPDGVLQDVGELSNWLSTSGC